MKITDIKIDGFGVWKDLALRSLSPEITVFYGPNEAGKTTLMQFLRSVLYGVSPARRHRYLPPLAGGRPGGSLKVLGDEGALTVRRYADRGPEDVGKVTIVTADGKEQGDRHLREALEQVDETTFNNIFAVGLREVQELGTLSDTAAAQWLYRLTSGLDRISLYDVIHLLANSRLRLLNSADQPSEIRTLVARRDQLHGELDELVARGRRWAQSAVKLRELADEVERRQSESRSLEARARRLEVAIGVKPLWAKREKIDDQLERFSGLTELAEGALETLDAVNQRINEHERQRDILKGQRHQLRDEAQRLGINDLLVRNGQRVEALVEQQEWLQSVERMASDLADQVAQLESRLASENERLAHEWTGAGKLPPRITADVVEQLTPQSRALTATALMVETARHELEIHRTGEHEYRAQIESAMTSGERLGLPKDLDDAGDLVARLRRRQQVEQRLEAARRQADDLQQQGQELVEEQVVPMPLFGWLMTIFVVGCVMLAAWWMLPTTFGQYGGWVAAVGIGGALFALLFKHLTEESASDRFDACHRQMEVVLNQIESAQQEQQQLDRELPMAEGSAAIRLQHAERHLAELERILPVESQRREAAEEIAAAERRLKLALEKEVAATTNWKAKLRALGLPDDLSPGQLETMAGQCELLAELESRIENRGDDMARRQREFAAVSSRISALAEETGLVDPECGALAQLDKLVAEYRKQRERVAHREELRERAKSLKQEELRHARAAIGFKRRRQALFEKCGVAEEQALRQLAAKHQEAAELRKRRAAVTREIAAAIGKHGGEHDFAMLLAPDAIGRLEHDWEALSAQAEQLDRELKEALQRRGAMIEQQRAQAADHALAGKQVDLDVVEEQLKRAVTSWRERATVSLMLERIRQEYEAHRQPETLKEASGYLRQLTSGKYTRIWTPLAHDILLVDTAGGESLPVHVLSRGTREQLFVSLRLALVAAYARRGIHLPMILDDVFVNFDAGRSKIAAEVLRDFAKQGHQLLIFTCHEHVWRMFSEIKVDTRRLPSRSGETEPEPILVAPQPEPAALLPAPEPVLAEIVEPVLVEIVDEDFEPELEAEPEVVEYDDVIDTELDEPEAEEIEYGELLADVPETPARSSGEIEYWWDDRQPRGWNGDSRDADSAGWLPEPVIYPDRW